MILVQQNYEPPQNGACFAEQTDAEPPRLIADVRHVPRRYTSPPKDRKNAQVACAIT